MPWRGKKAAKPATRHKRIDYDERDFEILAPQVSCFLFFVFQFKLEPCGNESLISLFGNREKWSW